MNTIQFLLVNLWTAVLLAAMPVAATAQNWPSKPLRMIVPVQAGSAPDVVARLFADKLGVAWGQGVVVDSRPGAGGIPGMSTLAHAANDGYTIGFVPAAMGAITPLVYKTPRFNVDTDLMSIATVGTSPLLLVTQAGNGIKSLDDLARTARSNPGKLNFAAAQTNSLPHLAGEMVNKAGEMGLFTVPYAGPPSAIIAVMTGEATVTADGIPGLVQHIKSGKLQTLAVTSSTRLAGFDSVPTVAETFPGYEVVGWFQIMVPVGTPLKVIETINRDVNKITRAPEVVARLAELGVYPRQDTVEAAGAFFVSQQRAMKKIVAELGIQPP